MSDHPQEGDPRIMLTAVRQMDDFARRFRRRLRDAATKLTEDGGHAAPIGPEAIVRAVPLACRELLSETAAYSEDERDSRGERNEAA